MPQSKSISRVQWIQRTLRWHRSTFSKQTRLRSSTTFSSSWTTSTIQLFETSCNLRIKRSTIMSSWDIWRNTWCTQASKASKSASVNSSKTWHQRSLQRCRTTFSRSSSTRLSHSSLSSLTKMNRLMTTHQLELLKNREEEDHHHALKTHRIMQQETTCITLNAETKSKRAKTQEARRHLSMWGQWLLSENRLTRAASWSFSLSTSLSPTASISTNCEPSWCRTRS